MGEDRHEKIQQKAYQIWEREGRPHGEHDRHWQQAVDELDRDDAMLGDDAPAADKAEKKARKPKTPKA
jgi:hypothetical protein